MKVPRKNVDDRSSILDAMTKEQKRAFSRLRIENLEKPYFISYRLKSFEEYNIWGSFGALFNNSRDSRRSIYAEVRVGSYDFDQTIDGKISREELDVSESTRFLKAPIENNAMALRIALWHLTDLKYKESLSQILKKKGRMVNEVIKSKKLPDFSREKKVHHFDPPSRFIIDEKYWCDIIRKLSGEFKKNKNFINSWVWFKARRESHFLTNTEGSRIITDQYYFSFSFHADALARDGMPLYLGRHYDYRSLDEFPDLDFFKERREELAHDLMELQQADVLGPYTGPALLKPEAAGIFLHEAIGHRLEGERQISDEEGQTFAGKLGKKILPRAISVIDDPTMKSYEGRSLMGHYLFDDQGVPAQKATLVENGILKGYLLSRTPVEDFSHSNGHGRNSEYEYPMARMGNFIAATREGHTEEELQEMLIKESIRCEKPHGIIIEDVEGGETNTSRYSFQAFKCSPKMVYKVNLDSGKKTLVRGVDFVGTPLTSISKIIAAGDTTEVHNGFCGAESGFIPVSTIAPALLVEELELQRTMGKNKKPPIIPFPRE